MAEGGQHPRQVFQIPITARVDSSLLETSTTTVFEGDRTNIIDSNIDTVIAGAAQPGPGVALSGPDNQPGDVAGNVAEEMQQMNLAENRPPPGRSGSSESSTKSKISFFDSASKEGGNAQSSSHEEVSKQPSIKVGEVESDTTANRREQKEDGGRSNEDVKISFSRAFMLVDKSRYLLAKSDYEGVAKLLDDPVITSSDDIVGKTLLAESHLMLGREAKALKVIEALKKVLVTSQMSGSDVMGYAKDLAANSAHIRAMILFPIACDIFHANASSPDDAVNTMFDCIWKMVDSVEALINEGDRARIVATDVGIDYMEKMYKNMSSIKNANPENKVVKEAWALHFIGYNYLFAGQNETSLKPRYRGVELMEQQFRGKESMYQVYGVLLHNIAVAHFNIGKFTEAEKYYLRAMKAIESATDYDSESEKREDIEVSKTDLNNTRAELGKK